jgi:hypothetical protein
LWGRRIAARTQRFWIDVNYTIEAQLSDKRGDNELPVLKTMMAAFK